MGQKLIDPSEYNHVVSRVREFFQAQGYLEVATQSRLSILAACEDPRTIATFQYAGQVWPLPQTGQMWLEFELLKKPCVPGFYCVSTSYRQEPNPIAGRHDLIFPMFEFELRGDVHVLRKLEDDLLQFLGFGSRFASINYEDAAKQYGVTELQAEHEGYLERDLGRVVFLERFPERTSPFWNMRRNGDGTVAKIDVLLHGIETIGSAERSTDKDEMRSAFHNISNGMYAEILYSHFGRKRVEQELEMFLSFDFFPRCGGGMGITRLIRAMKLSGLLC